MSYGKFRFTKSTPECGKAGIGITVADRAFSIYLRDGALLRF